MMTVHSETGKLPHLQEAPNVSVLIAAYNGEAFLRSTIVSILNQTFSDFELIVIDDASTDATPQIMAEINDQRLRVARNERNVGIAATLNKGITLATGRYIAIQDHDDISSPDRLELQSQFLGAHPSIAMVGSSCRIIDASGNIVRNALVKEDDATLRWGLLWYNPFFHTTLMIRREALVEIGGYSTLPEWRFSEDYEMMSRVAQHYAVANLPQLLGSWRMHPTSASSVHIERQCESAANISFRNVQQAWGCSVASLSRMERSLHQSMWSFQFASKTESAKVSSDQLCSAPSNLIKLERVFATSTPDLKQPKRVRAARYWRWAKHSAALALRERRSSRFHLVMLMNSMKLLVFAVGAFLFE